MPYGMIVVWDSAVSRLGKAIYAIDAFPDDAQLWQIAWIAGVAYNASVPSEPLEISHLDLMRCAHGN